jgi:spore maturation protein CgeB
MQLAYFSHSVASCWNHGNAHFQRGVLRELARRGHRVRVFEPENGWSRTNLRAERGEAPFAAFAAGFPEITPELYATEPPLDAMIEGADVVIVHEWTDPALVAAIGRARRHGSFRLLFHDTHHRAASDPQKIAAFDLGNYDAVLAFGGSLAEIYRSAGWGERVFVWHEAANTALFRPPTVETVRRGLVWIGNWGDGEREAELAAFLLRPAAAASLPLEVYGVRYPPAALAALRAAGARYRGWVANAEVPRVFATHLATVHVPRRPYAHALPGIPTIRVFEALACGIPLVSAPWDDCEGLFRPGADYLVARSETEMTRHLRALAHDPALRTALAESGLQSIRARHSCAHRVDELLAIAAALGAPADARAA